MYTKSNSKLHPILIFILNGFSIIFKTISFIYLKMKALNPVTYKEVFIISVDNLSFGGTGKTPLVIQIGEQLQKQNLKFAIVIRGYKSRYEKRGATATPESTVSDIGDEAALLKKIFKNQDILVGKNRHDSIKKAIQRQNQIILLDDGFQSTDVFKNLKIMLVNPHHPYYYLRNFKSLARKEDIILTYSPSLSPEPENKKKSPFPEIFPSKKKPWAGVYHFELGKFYDQRGKETSVGKSPILGFSAVGDNSRFKRDLSKFNLTHFRGFPDHYTFTPEELSHLNSTRKQVKAEYLVCTEKDFIRIFPLLRPDIPLIYVKNHIKYTINIIEIILTHAKEAGIIQT